MKKFLTLLIILVAVSLPVACVHPTEEDVYFKVTFGGEYVTEFVMTVKKDDKAIMPSDPIVEGKTFFYWVTSDGNRYDFDKPVTSDIMLYAVWQNEAPQVKYYTVRFFGVNGELIGSPQIVAEGSSAVDPAVIPDEFFVFDCWDKDFSVVTEDMDVYAKQKYSSTDASLFTYSTNKDGTYSISGIKKGAVLPQMSGGYVKLALPTEYEGVSITSIDDGAKYNGVFSRMKILSVYIPSCYKKIGSYAFYGNPALMNVTFNEGLTHIGDGAFMATLGEGNVINGPYVHSGADAYVSSLTRVKLPASLEIIGAYAFNHIGNVYENGTYVMQEVEVEFCENSSLTLIGERAFEGVMIREIKLPTTKVKLRINNYAFAADTYYNWVCSGSYEHPCSKTIKVTLPKTITQIGDYAFYGLGNFCTYYNGNCFDTYNDVEFVSDELKLDKLGDYAFYGANLTGRLTLSVEQIGAGAFFGQKLSYISLEAQRVGSYAFARSGGEVMTELELKNNMIALGDGAFMNNVGISRINLPDTLFSIGSYAFAGCTSLRGSVTFESLAQVGACAFQNCGIEYVDIIGKVRLGRQCFESSGLKEIRGTISEVDTGTFADCKNLTVVSLPANLYEIPVQLFYGCESLSQIDLPESLTVIGRSAFYACRSLQSIKLPMNVKTIGIGAFENCSALKTVDFDGDVVNVDAYAFAFCASLSSIDLPGSVENIGDYAFQGSGLTTFKTPASLSIMGRRVFFQEEYTYVESGGNIIYGDYNGNTGNEKVTKVTLPKLSAIIISAETGKINFSSQGTFDGSEITWFEVEEGNKVYSSKDGILYSADETKLIMYIRNDSVNEINLPEGLIEIEERTFFNNPYLYSVTLPQSLKIIGDYAFYNCVHLKSIKLPSGIISIGKNAFSGSYGNMSELANIEFSKDSSINSIGDGAFAYNKALKSVKLPASLVTLGANAFYSASALENVDLSQAANLMFIGDRAFSGDDSRAPKIKSIDFSGCVSLESTGFNAFVGCASLTSINFALVSIIDSGSFSSCTALTDLTIGSHIEEIGSSAFRNCTGLKNIIIPEDNVLTNIKSYAFAGNIDKKVNYTQLNLSAAMKLTAISDYAFAYGKLTSVVLPKTAFVLGDDVFNSCSSLTKVDLGEGITEIGENVFRYCTSLKELNLPSSLTTISKDAFRSLNLTKVNIGAAKKGNSIVSIGKNAFFDCKNLTEVNIYGDNVPGLFAQADNLSFHCFDSLNVMRIIDNLSINIDKGMKSRYVRSGFEANGWEIYKDYIKERV